LSNFLPSNPPPLPWNVRSAFERWILIISFIGLMAAGALLILHHWGYSWGCAWKSMTSIPCAGCGGTRALHEMSAGNIRNALLLNPGIVLSVGVLAAVNIYAVAVLVFRFAPWRPNFPRWRWWAFSALLLNWLYLLWAERV
jgi:hypothetical protein